MREPAFLPTSRRSEKGKTTDREELNSMYVKNLS